jgi:TonB-dependent receptor
MAAYKTYVRPNRADENPTTSVSYSQNTDSTRYNIVLGKNELRPYLANSFDLGLEWYNRKGSVVALAVYQKNISGYIYNYDRNTRPDLACPANGLFNGVDYGTGPLTYNPNPAVAGEECRAVNGDPNNLDLNGQPNKVVVNTTGSTNSVSMVKLSGAELSVSQNLDFLPPGFWRNFGFLGNYSYTKQSGTLPNGQKIRLTNAAKQNYNLIAFYEQGGFGSRLVFNRRGDYYVAGGSVQFDRQVKARSQLDGVLSYRFKNGLQVALDAYNLTNAMVVQFQEDERLLRNVDYDGRTYTLSLRGQF